MIALWMALVLQGQVDSNVSETPSDIEYSEVYLVDEESRELPRFFLHVGYALNISNSFVDVNSLTLGTQWRLWKYLSTGILGQISQSQLSSSGETVRELESIDIQSTIPVPRWAAFSHSQFQLMLGKWNFLNLGTLGSELLAGGGFGFINRGKDLNGPNETLFSYLWSAENRFIWNQNYSVSVGAFGYRNISFFQAALGLRF